MAGVLFDKVIAALIQLPCGAHKADNILNLERNIRVAADSGADLVLLQELHDNRYLCQSEDMACFDKAETIPGPTTKRLGKLAAELKLVVVGSVFEKRAPGLYHNTAVVLDRDGSLAGYYRKMHIPDDPGYYEKFYFTPGDTGFRPVATSIGNLGVLVCWDQWFPEAARSMALAGADMLLYPTAIGWNPQDELPEQSRQLDAWITVQRGHAISNGLPLLTCNRVGMEPDPSGNSSGILFWGHSFACGPQGEMLAQAEETEKMLLVEMDLKRIESVRNSWPFFRDRRIDAYERLLLRFDDTDGD